MSCVNAKLNCLVSNKKLQHHHWPVCLSLTNLSNLGDKLAKEIVTILGRLISQTNLFPQRLLPPLPEEQARKSSEDAQAAGFAQFEKVWAG